MVIYHAFFQNCTLLFQNLVVKNASNYSISILFRLLVIQDVCQLSNLACLLHGVKVK